jgi:hypothetical protein
MRAGCSMQSAALSSGGGGEWSGLSPRRRTKLATGMPRCDAAATSTFYRATARAADQPQPRGTEHLGAYWCGVQYEHLVTAGGLGDLGRVTCIFAQLMLRRRPGRFSIGPADLHLRDGDRLAETRESLGEAADRHVGITDGK